MICGKHWKGCKPACSSQKSSQHRAVSRAVASMIRFSSCFDSSHEMTNSAWRTFRTNVCTTYGKYASTHAPQEAPPMCFWCLGNRRHGFAVANVPAKVSRSVSTGLENFLTITFMTTTLFCSGRNMERRPGLVLSAGTAVCGPYRLH